MDIGLALGDWSFEPLIVARRALPVLLLAIFWTWESWRPFFGLREGRGKHAVRNLALALVNTLVLGLLFAWTTALVAQWAQRNNFGVLYWLNVSWPWHLMASLIILDAWMYFWHRANHVIPFLWRFHRMHHSDPAVDVTTATRFHLGEHLGAITLRMGLIALFGLSLWSIVLYELAVIAITQFHHADVSIGRCDRPLRWLIVTPYMHKVHHSNWQPETDSNYSTLFSIWDRLAGTFRMREDPHTVVFGLRQFPEPEWQSFMGMWKTPFVQPQEQDREEAPESAGTR